MFEFAWPWVFAILPLPILVWWLLPPYRARQASVQVPFFDRLAAATGQTPQQGAVVLRRRAFQMIVAALAWILLVAALARPQWVSDPVTRDVSARDLILAVDISGSMDLPNKLPLLKSAFSLLINNLRDVDTLSIVTYGGSVSVELGPTSGKEKKKIL